MAVAAREWAAALAARLALPVTMRDERLSSFEAERRLGRMPRGRSGGAAVTNPAERLPGANRSRGRERHPPGRARRAADGDRRRCPCTRASGLRGRGRRPGGAAMSVRGGRGPREDMAAPVSDGGGGGPTATSAPAATAGGRATSAATTGTATAGAASGAFSGFVIFLVVLAVVVLVALLTVRPADRPPRRRALGRGQRRARCGSGSSPTSSARTWAPSLTAPAAATRPRSSSRSSPATRRPPSRPGSTRRGSSPPSGHSCSRPASTTSPPKLTAGRYALAMNLTPAEVVSGLACQQPDRASHPGHHLPRGPADRADDRQARHPHGDRRGPDGVLRPRDEAHRTRSSPTTRGCSTRRSARRAPRSRASCTRRRTRLRTDATDSTTAEDLIRMMLDAFHDGGRTGAARRSREARPHLLRGAHARLDRRARGGPGRGAAAHRRRLPEPDQPGAQRQARPAPGRPNDHLRRGHRQPRRVQPGLGEVRVLDGAQGRQARATSSCPRSSPGYNTYTSAACRPGRSPRRPLASLDAALAPDTKTGYTYFVAIPDGKGAHDFAKSLAEHEKKLQKYGY